MLDKYTAVWYYNCVVFAQPIKYGVLSKRGRTRAPTVSDEASVRSGRGRRLTSKSYLRSQSRVPQQDITRRSRKIAVPY